MALRIQRRHIIDAELAPVKGGLPPKQAWSNLGFRVEGLGFRV